MTPSPPFSLELDDVRWSHGRGDKTNDLLNEKSEENVDERVRTIRGCG